MRGRAFVVGALALLALAALLPLGAAEAPLDRPALAFQTEATGFSASASWNGASIASASTPSTAITTSFGSPVAVNFTWFSGPGVTEPFAITDAVVHILYLGQQAWTKDQAFTPPMSAGTGSYSLSSDLTESRYLVEGLFLIQADLLSNTNGTVWSQSFYVNVLAPYHFTVAALALGIIGLYELVSLARVGPHALSGTKGKGTPPAQPPVTSPSPTPAQSSPPSGTEAPK
jgi:hypothetical protein